MRVRRLIQVADITIVELSFLDPRISQKEVLHNEANFQIRINKPKVWVFIR